MGYTSNSWEDSLISGRNFVNCYFVFDNPNLRYINQTSFSLADHVSEGFLVISYMYLWKYRYLGFHRNMAPCGRKLRSQGVSVWMSRDIRPKAVSRLRRELAASTSATSISHRLGVTGYSFYLEKLFWPASHRATLLESDRAYECV